MKTIRFLAIILANILIYSCASLKAPHIDPLLAPTIIRNDTIEGYKYIFITPTSNITSSSGGIYGGQYGVYGASTSKSVNPSDAISGILLKEGYTRIPELKQELLDETMIVNYGESGRRNRGLGYTIEVTIQFISAKSHKSICTCTAEGQGQTEADDIRQAISRCLSALLSKEN